MAAEPEPEPRYRASTGQEAIWVAERLTPAAGAYVEAFAWRLAPAPDAARLSAALAAVVARHEVLRTALVEEDGRLWQVVRPPVGAPLAVGVDGADLAGWLRAPIDVASGAPLRAALVPDEEGGALLGLALHHAVVDSWSLQWLLAEWSEAYAGAQPHEPAVQFGPWSDAERAAPAAEEEVIDEMAALLRRESAPSESPSAPLGAAPPSASSSAPLEAAALPPRALASSSDLADAARRRRVTVFELVACGATRAVRAALGPDDAVLGAVVSRRDTTAAQAMLGYCATVVPIACPPGCDLDAVAHGVRLARRARHVPASALVARIGRRSAPGRQPLFDAVLAYERGAPPAPALPGIEATPVPVAPAAAKFTLTLTVRDDGDAITAGAEWAAGEVDDAAAAAVLERLGPELEALSSDPTPVRRRAAAPIEQAGRPRPAAPPAAPPAWRDGLELDVAAAWTEVIGRPPGAIDEGFFGAGGDSLGAIHLCAGLARRGLGRIEPAELVDAATVPGIAAALRARGDAPADPCLVRLRGGEGPPIVLVHPVGGTVTWYAPLARLLEHPAPIWALQARGLTPGEPFHDSIASMAADYAALVRERFAEPPLVVGGYSMGGTVAAQMARELDAGLLLLLDTTARPAPRSEDPHYGVRVLVEKALRLRFDWQAIAAAPRDRQAGAILAAAQAAGRLPPDYDAERLRRMIEVYEHNARAVAGHEPEPYDGRSVLIRTDSDEAAVDPTLGWGRLLADLEIHTAPGTHFDLMDAVNAPAVARRLDGALGAIRVA